MKYDFNTLYERRNTGSEKWAEVEAMDGNIVPVSIADMEFITAPEIREALSDYISKNILGYTSASDEYLNEVVKWQREQHEFDIKKEWIVNTPGVVNAIYNLINALTKPDDGVIIFRPVYRPFTMSIEGAGRKVVNCPLINDSGHYTIDFEKFEEEAKKSENKLLIFCSPHNPVGRVWTREEVRRIVEISKKYNLYIICDEIWNDIIMSGYEFTTMGRVAEDYLDNIAICTAASKTFNLAGLVCSNIIVPGEIMREKLNEELSRSHVEVNALGYAGTMFAYRYGKPWMEEMLQVIEGNYKYAKEFFEREIKGSVVSPLEATYVMWVDLRCLNMSEEEQEDFMRKRAKCFTDPGFKFGDEGAGFERINLACPLYVLKETLERIKNAL